MELNFSVDVSVGYKPDMVKFSPDCRTLLVANEGETEEESGYIVDYEGSVTLLRLDGSGGVANRTDLDFTSFNARSIITSIILNSTVRPLSCTASLLPLAGQHCDRQCNGVHKPWTSVTRENTQNMRALNKNLVTLKLLGEAK